MSEATYLIWSQKAFETSRSSYVAIVPDEQGGTKDILYSVRTTDLKEAQRAWGDIEADQIRWMGNASNIKGTRRNSVSHKKASALKT